MGQTPPEASYHTSRSCLHRGAELWPQACGVNWFSQVAIAGGGGFGGLSIKKPHELTNHTTPSQAFTHISPKIHSDTFKQHSMMFYWNTFANTVNTLKNCPAELLPRWRPQFSGSLKQPLKWPEITLNLGISTSPNSRSALTRWKYNTPSELMVSDEAGLIFMRSTNVE